jgi:hypothetical protein
LCGLNGAKDRYGSGQGVRSLFHITHEEFGVWFNICALHVLNRHGNVLSSKGQQEYADYEDSNACHSCLE